MSSTHDSQSVERKIVHKTKCNAMQRIYSTHTYIATYLWKEMTGVASK